MYETRKIAASGHETTDTDSGIVVSTGTYPLEIYLLGTNHYQIEMLTQLDQLPEKGSLVLVSVPKISQGSGFPARVVAIVPPAQNPTVLWDYYENVVQKKAFVDLTHSFGVGIPNCCAFPEMTRTTLFNYSSDGFMAEWFCHMGQWGTHVDPPAHFIQGLRWVDQISPKEMIFPLVVFDVSEKVAANADYQLTMEDVQNWEEKYGPVPPGSFAIMRTDWSSRWPNSTALLNRDSQGTSHYPGWTLPVLTYLYDQRNITASGHETTDTDYGIDASQEKYPLETYILMTNHYQIELLANVNELPEFGAILLVSFPKIENGSGFPARAFAIIPDQPQSSASSPVPLFVVASLLILLCITL